MGSVGANKSTSTNISVVNAEAEAELAKTSLQKDREAQVTQVLKNIKSGKRMQTGTVNRPSDGHEISYSVELIKTRDYWGRATGHQSYTVYVYDNSQRNEYGNRERLWYNYGIEDLRKAKEQVARFLK